MQARHASPSCKPIVCAQTAAPLQALSVLSRPANLQPALASLHKTMDDVWVVAGGDTSSDASWYSKRAALGR